MKTFRSPVRRRGKTPPPRHGAPSDDGRRPGPAGGVPMKTSSPRLPAGKGEAGSRARLLLLYPGIFHGKWGRRVTVKPHLVYLYTALEEFFDVRILDLEREFGAPADARAVRRFQAKALARIGEEDFEVLAVSCYTSASYLPSMGFAKAVRKTRPGAWIVVGGYHATHRPEDFLRSGSPFDQVVVGEVENWTARLRRVKGDFRGGGRGGRLVTGAKSHPVKPAKIPTEVPYYRDARGARSLGCFLSTGCPYACRFCLEYRRRWNALPVDAAIDYVKRIMDGAGPKLILFYDACFGADKIWRRAFLRRLAALNPTTGFWMETRPELLEEEDVDLLGSLRVRVDFGIESFSEGMLAIMNKARNPGKFLGQFLRVHGRLNRCRIPHQAFLILNHPGETRRTLAEAERYILEHLLPVPDSHLHIGYQRYSFFPGSEVFRRIREYEKRYGARIVSREWWKRGSDQSRLSRVVQPSSDAAGTGYRNAVARLLRLIGRVNARSSFDVEAFQRAHIDPP